MKKQTYELIDVEDGNLIGVYRTENAALHIIRESVKRNGADALATVALGVENEMGRIVEIAQGEDLVKLAFCGHNPSLYRRVTYRCSEFRARMFESGWISIRRTGHVRRLSTGK